MSATTSGTIADNLSMARPMWRGPPQFSRPPNPGAGPNVVSASGLGSGGGAGAAGGNSDSAFGHIRLFIGLAPSASGTVVLQWPVTPPVALSWTANWATLVVTGTNPYTVTWTALAALASNSRAALDYQWSAAV